MRISKTSMKQTEPQKKTKNPEKACGKLTDTTDVGNYVLILTLAADLVSRGSLKKLFTN